MTHEQMEFCKAFTESLRSAGFFPQPGMAIRTGKTPSCGIARIAASYNKKDINVTRYGGRVSSLTAKQRREYWVDLTDWTTNNALRGAGFAALLNNFPTGA
jgi:hypothetical protein